MEGQNTYRSCLATTHRHVNSDRQTANCCPSQQTTQCSPAVLSAQPLLASGTVYQSPFDLHRLPTPFDDTWRLICSPITPPSTNCYHPRLRFAPVSTYGALQMLTTYLLTLRAVVVLTRVVMTTANTTCATTYVEPSAAATTISHVSATRDPHAKKIAGTTACHTQTIMTIVIDVMM